MPALLDQLNGRYAGKYVRGVDSEKRRRISSPIATGKRRERTHGLHH